MGVSTQRLRDMVNQIQGSSGYRDGTALETLRAIARQYGLQTSGPSESSSVRAMDHRRRAAAGLQGLAGDHAREVSDAAVELVLGLGEPPLHRSGRNDIARLLRPRRRRCRAAASGGTACSAPETSRGRGPPRATPGLGIALGPQPGGLSIPTARLLGSEFLGHGPIVFAGNQSAGAGALESPAPLPPALGASAADSEVAPLPPDLGLAQQSDGWVPAPAPTQSSFGQSSGEPLAQAAKSLAPRFSGAASDLKRLAPALSDRWAHSLGLSTTSADVRRARLSRAIWRLPRPRALTPRSSSRRVKVRGPTTRSPSTSSPSASEGRSLSSSGATKYNASGRPGSRQRRDA